MSKTLIVFLLMTGLACGPSAAEEAQMADEAEAAVEEMAAELEEMAAETADPLDVSLDDLADDLALEEPAPSE